MVEKFNTAIFRAETITKVEVDNLALKVEDDVIDPLECLPLFPTFCFNDKEYLLLNDIQHLFGLKEDFALALLALRGELDDGFVDRSPSPLAILDTRGDNFLEKQEAALVCTGMIEEYEKLGLPTEEEFRNIQERLGILDMGHEDQSYNIEDQSYHVDFPKMDGNKGSIDPYNESILDLDESPQVNLLFSEERPFMKL